MKRFSEQFYTKSKSITLSSTEKKQLQERLTSYMEYHPLPAELRSVKTSSISSTSPVLNDAFKTFALPFSLMFKSSAVVAAFVLIVVPFMAEQSVPGDTLYAVKVQFNEEVRSTLTFDSYQKVEWETQRVNRRIAEARLLQSEGRLTDEVEAEVAQAVRTHTQNAQKEIDVIRATDAEEATIASIEFDSNLEAQATSLKEDESALEVAITSTSTRAQSVNLIADAVDESRALNEQSSASTTPSYIKLMARVEQSTTRLYELSGALEALKPQTKEDVARRIADIERSVAQAIEQSQADEVLSREVLVDVLKRTQKLIVFLTDIEVSDTMNIEELVPVMLTNEEEIEKVSQYKIDILEKEAQLERMLTNSGQMNTGVSQKIAFGLEQIEKLTAQSSESVKFADIQSFDSEVIEILNDLLVLLEKSTTTKDAVIEISEPVAQASTTVSTTSEQVIEDTTVSTSTNGAATMTPAVVR